MVRVFPLAPFYNLLSVFLLLFCNFLVLYIALLIAHIVLLIYLFLISLVLSSPTLRKYQTCLLLLFFFIWIQYYSWDTFVCFFFSDLFFYSLRIHFSFIRFFFYLIPVLIYIYVSGMFVSQTFLFSFLLLFPLILSHLHRIFSALFFFTSFPLIFLIFFQSSFPPLYIV